MIHSILLLAHAIMIMVLMYEIFSLNRKINQKNELMRFDIEEVQIELEYLRKEIERNKHLEKYMPPEEQGLIKKLCFRYQCNHPIWVREYRRFDIDNPLLCPDCWKEVCFKRDVKKDIYKDIRSDIEILKDIFEEMEIRIPEMNEMLTKERTSRVEEQQ